MFIHYPWLLYHIQVLIAGHVPPGVCGRCNNTWWMRPSLNERFVKLLQQYHSIIVAAIFGHEHTDSFHVVYDGGRSQCVLAVHLCCVSEDLGLLIAFLCLQNIIVVTHQAHKPRPFHYSTRSSFKLL